MTDDSRRNFSQYEKSRFATTHWSVVLAAGKSSSTNQKQALEKLCQSYWFPLYAYLRKLGYTTHQAEDHTQGFFVHILEKHDLRTADPKYGKFRSFLLVKLKGFLSDQRDHDQAQKRGGGQKILSLSFENAEDQYALEPADKLSPEILFEKSWALTVLDRTMNRLENDMVRKNKQKLFEHLKIYLTTDKDTAPYQDMAAELEMTEASVRVAVHRLRRQYRKFLRDEIAQTVGDKDMVDEEMGYLFEVLGC